MAVIVVVAAVDIVGVAVVVAVVVEVNVVEVAVLWEKGVIESCVDEGREFQRQRLGHGHLRCGRLCRDRLDQSNRPMRCGGGREFCDCSCCCYCYWQGYCGDDGCIDGGCGYGCCCCFWMIWFDGLVCLFGVGGDVYDCCCCM